jgi:hypothetical protein
MHIPSSLSPLPCKGVMTVRSIVPHVIFAGDGGPPCLDQKVDQWLIFDKPRVKGAPFRMSLDVDNVILFLSPTLRDLQTTRGILSIFEGASGLSCNLSKCQLAVASR